jgi:hypothetical protein
MNIQLEKAEIDTEAGTLKVLVSGLVSVKELESDRYDKFSDLVKQRVASHLAEHIILNRMNEILEKVDIETITKRIQLEVIQNFGRPR